EEHVRQQLSLLMAQARASVFGGVIELSPPLCPNGRVNPLEPADIDGPFAQFVHRERRSLGQERLPRIFIVSGTSVARVRNAPPDRFRDLRPAERMLNVPYALRRVKRQLDEALGRYAGFLHAPGELRRRVGFGRVADFDEMAEDFDAAIFGESRARKLVIAN